jgi:allophanate hydrolase subunit 2
MWIALELANLLEQNDLKEACIEVFYTFLIIVIKSQMIILYVHS